MMISSKFALALLSMAFLFTPTIASANMWLEDEPSFSLKGSILAILIFFLFSSAFSSWWGNRKNKPWWERVGLPWFVTCIFLIFVFPGILLVFIFFPITIPTPFLGFIIGFGIDLFKTK